MGGGRQPTRLGSAAAVEAPLFCLVVEPSVQIGLREVGSLIVDKITTVRRSRLGERVGRLSSGDMVRLDRAIVVFLGLAGCRGGNAQIGQQLADQIRWLANRSAAEHQPLDPGAGTYPA